MSVLSSVVSYPLEMLKVVMLKTFHNPNSKVVTITTCFSKIYSGLILGLYPGNEGQRYFATMSLIGWVQA